MASDNKKVDAKKERKITLIISICVIVLLLLVLISRNFGTFNLVKVSKNNNTIFSVTDLTIGNLKFSDNEKTIEKELGKPKKEEKVKKDIYNYKIYYYDGLKLTLKENYNDYILVGCEISSSKYKTSRDIKVNNKILKVMRKYKVDNSYGTYLYGNYTSDALNNDEIKDNIYMGVRSNKEVVYINKDASVNGMKANIARLNISYSHGKVKKIIWSYDFE